MPFSLLIPASVNFTRSLTYNSPLYRAKTISNIWNFRVISYLSLFTYIGLSSREFDVSKDYLEDLHWIPEHYPIMKK